MERKRCMRGRKMLKRREEEGKRVGEKGKKGKREKEKEEVNEKGKRREEERKGKGRMKERKGKEWGRGRKVEMSVFRNSESKGVRRGGREKKE